MSAWVVVFGVGVQQQTAQFGMVERPKYSLSCEQGSILPLVTSRIHSRFPDPALVLPCEAARGRAGGRKDV